MVGQLRELKQIRGQPGHQLARPIAVVKIEAQLLHMAEQIPANVRLHPDAKGMAEIGHNVI